MTDADTGRWVDDPPLPEIAPPPPGVPLTLGAQLIRVYGITERTGEPLRHGYTEAVIVARTPYPASGWAALAAWQGAWQQRGRTTGAARWGWLRIEPGDVIGEECRVEAIPPPAAASRSDGDEWHGWHELSEFAKAVRQAAESLPESDRTAALTPRPPRHLEQTP